MYSTENATASGLLLETTLGTGCFDCEQVSMKALLSFTHIFKSTLCLNIVVKVKQRTVYDNRISLVASGCRWRVCWAESKVFKKSKTKSARSLSKNTFFFRHGRRACEQ